MYTPIFETWLHDSIFDGEILSYGYTIYRKDRSARGGGVLIAIEDSVSSSSLLYNISPTDLEVITVNIDLSNDPITLYTVYVPPIIMELSIIILCCLILLTLHHQ